MALLCNIHSQVFVQLVSKRLSANKSGYVVWWLTVLVTHVCIEINVVQFFIAVNIFQQWSFQQSISVISNEKHQYEPNKVLLAKL